MWPIRPFAQSVCDLIDSSQYDDWDFDGFTAKHKETKLEIWTENHVPGLFFFQPHGSFAPHFNIFERYKIYRRLVTLVHRHLNDKQRTAK